MKEFGSDYHFIKDLKLRKAEYQLPFNSRFYANGRQAIKDLISFKKWKRIWMPEYFCYEIIAAIKEVGIEVMFYYDNPSIVENDAISTIPFQDCDVLFRMNYFGLRSKRDNSKIAVPVIEDHSHDLIGEWAQSSNADWCIASLRKTLPISDGGILWSHKKHKLPQVVSSSNESNMLAALRFKAMRKKANYLQGLTENKDEYLGLFAKTEAQFNELKLSVISSDSFSIVKSMDIESWYKQKKYNWLILSKLSYPKVEILHPEHSGCYPFSLVLKFNNKKNRDIVRSFLLKKNVYPSILWQIPNAQSPDIVDYGNTSLSIHCDARYNKDDIKILKDILIEAFTEMV